MGLACKLKSCPHSIPVASEVGRNGGVGTTQSALESKWRTTTFGGISTPRNHHFRRNFKTAESPLSAHLRRRENCSADKFSFLHSLFHACDVAATANGLKNQRFAGSVPTASCHGPPLARRSVTLRGNERRSSAHGVAHSHHNPSSRRKGMIASKYPSAGTVSANSPS